MLLKVSGEVKKKKENKEGRILCLFIVDFKGGGTVLVLQMGAKLVFSEFFFFAIDKEEWKNNVFFFWCEKNGSIFIMGVQ